MQAIRPDHVSFNIVTCEWECIPETCSNDTYYWDSKLCRCFCYPQECGENYSWDLETCSCVCKGIPAITLANGDIVNECPCGTVWDEDCCNCEPCQDQGLCNLQTEFFNPNTCECTCIPLCCEEPKKFNSMTCECSIDECPYWVNHGQT